MADETADASSLFSAALPADGTTRDCGRQSAAERSASQVAERSVGDARHTPHATRQISQADSKLMFILP